MNIEKAIIVGQQYLRDDEPHDLGDFIDFVNLGIEALKRVKDTDHSRGYYGERLLPGETEY